MDGIVIIDGRRKGKTAIESFTGIVESIIIAAEQYGVLKPHSLEVSGQIQIGGIRIVCIVTTEKKAVHLVVRINIEHKITDTLVKFLPLERELVLDGPVIVELVRPIEAREDMLSFEWIALLQIPVMGEIDKLIVYER